MPLIFSAHILKVGNFWVFFSLFYSLINSNNCLKMNILVGFKIKLIWFIFLDLIRYEYNGILLVQSWSRYLHKVSRFKYFHWVDIHKDSTEINNLIPSMINISHGVLLKIYKLKSGILSAEGDVRSSVSTPSYIFCGVINRNYCDLFIFMCLWVHTVTGHDR